MRRPGDTWTLAGCHCLDHQAHWQPQQSHGCYGVFVMAIIDAPLSGGDGGRYQHTCTTQALAEAEAACVDLVSPP